MKKISTPIAFAIVIILAVIVGGGILMESRRLEIKIPEISIPTQTPVVQNSPAESPNIETADWKTYTNTQYGFEFKYPADWNIYDLVKVNPDSYSVWPLAIGISSEKSLIDGKNTYGINMYKNPFISVEIVNEDWRVGTREWKKFKLGQLDGEMDDPNCYLGCLLVIENTDMRLIINTSENPLNNGVTNQMLSTFKFINN